MNPETTQPPQKSRLRETLEIVAMIAITLTFLGCTFAYKKLTDVPPEPYCGVAFETPQQLAECKNSNRNRNKPD